MDTVLPTLSATFSITDEELMNYQYTTALLSCEESLTVNNSNANYLKKGHSMKLPLILYNHCHVKGVLQSAYWLRQDLEMHAREWKANTGFYIRPIVLFVLKSQTADHVNTLKKIKEEFIEGGIAEEEIKIKTNELDELSGIDLMDEECDVRYVITIPDLKEQWRCPFAYVIASLEERAVASDLTTILNCLLPQPLGTEITNKALSTGYIITASTRFEKVAVRVCDYLHDLGVEPEKIILQNKMVQLLKGMSIWEVLSKANGEVKGVRFGGKKVDF